MELKVLINEIKSNPNNPRTIKDDKFKKLVNSLKSFPEMATVRPIVVNKDMIVLGGNMRLKAMKEAGWKEGAAHGWYSDRKQTTILEFDRPQRNAEHPTMKPIPLFSYQIGNSSKQGDIVADGFGGSGTTMVACHQMQRKAYLVEFDPKYCQVIIDRMRKIDPSIKIKKNGVDYGE